MNARARRNGDSDDGDDETVWGLLCQAEAKIRRAKELYRGRNAAVLAALTAMPVSFDDPPPAAATAPAVPTAPPAPPIAAPAPATAPAAIAPRSRARR